MEKNENDFHWRCGTENPAIPVTTLQAKSIFNSFGQRWIKVVISKGGLKFSLRGGWHLHTCKTGVLTWRHRVAHLYVETLWRNWRWGYVCWSIGHLMWNYWQFYCGWKVKDSRAYSQTPTQQTIKSLFCRLSLTKFTWLPFPHPMPSSTFPTLLYHPIQTS